MMEQDFYNFLIAWRDWARADKPSSQFVQSGLCPNYVNEWGNIGEREERRQFFSTRMKWEFGYAYNFPFNRNSVEYYEEADASLSHKNPHRLAWVERKIAEYEENKK
jgi:hypothetical protein